MSGEAKEKLLMETIPLPNLPDSLRPAHGDVIPPGLIGARILRFGAAKGEFDLEGGGLIVDYVPEGSEQLRRVVFSLNDLGMWVTYLGEGPPIGDGGSLVT
jgi:hypothetical protein